jgi:hypothetical protein
LAYFTGSFPNFRFLFFHFRRTITIIMSAGFDSAFRRVKELVADFRANEKFYLSPAYQEQEARRDFIDKFWLALGWDVNHDTQKNPLEQEVKVERKEHSNSQRRADYAFYLHPNYRDVRFYVEAKKPHGDIATADNYFQINRYGWSGKTKIGILHDFEQFEIVDCRLEPNIDKALSRNIRKYKYPDYEDAEKFAEIYWIFSHEAVANGSLGKFIATLPKRRAKDVEPSEIDDSFLKMLDQLRDELARLFKNKNPKLDGDCLTEITQRTLDRFVFTRFLEDKFIEPQRIISTFGSRGSAWDDFITASRRLDKIYNGVVYKHNDWLDEKVKIDADAFAEICRRFSHVNSPYDFNEIPIHILGSIYERFLGKVIVTTDKRARLEEKPEVRKAGGVYYTPEYIVRYIVENTVGKLIAGKTPGQIAEMRFADIACGSGSFLLGVYDLLIRHHTRYYNENRDKAKIAGKVKKEHKADVEEREDGLHLTLYKKREILLANIYGVDIDPQAVEVAQLSLYLKLLQDETPGSARQYYLDFEQQALLPKLDKNIVCGNSLIGTDILTGQLFASDEEKKLNPMDFEQRFPHIFRKVGRDTPCAPGLHDAAGSGVPALPDELHDAAPGEPDFGFPGVPLHGAFSYKKKKGAKAAPPAVPEFEGGFDAIVGNPPYGVPFSRIEEEYLANHFPEAAKFPDSYCFFILRALRLVRQSGVVSFIVPNTFCDLENCDEFRSSILRRYSLEEIWQSGWAFQEAVVDTLVFRLWSKPPKVSSQINVVIENHNYSRSVAEFLGNELCKIDYRNRGDDRQIVAKASSGCPNVSQIATVKAGVKMYEKGKGTPPQTVKTMAERPYSTNGKCPPKWKPLFRGGDVERYFLAAPKEFVNYGPWLAAPRSPDLFSGPKLLMRRTDDRLLASIEEGSAICVNSCHVIKLNQEALSKMSYNYVLALLNSKLLQRIFEIQNPQMIGKVFAEIKVIYVERLPIRPIDFSKPADKAKHDRMVELVEQMLAARKQLAGAQSDKDKDFYTNRCDGLDRQIDALVYDLYALTPAEIQIVEGAAK